MKIYNLFTITAIVFCGIITGCSHNAPVKFNPETAKSNLPPANTLATAQILAGYYNLKDALVATDSQKAAKALNEMLDTIVNFRDKLARGRVDSSISGETGKNLDRLSIKLIAQIGDIRKVNEKDCEKMRIYFKPLSDTLYALLKDIGIKDIQAYHHYCPMAMNEKGAYWLSASPEIENPYFGQKMLTCGELVDTIQ